MTRKQTENSAPANATDTPPLAIPPGVDASVNIKYNTRLEPNQTGQRNELDELAELADSEPLPLPLDTPLDELSEFCALWRNFLGYPLTIVRLPDPPERKMFGQGYARACNQTERLGELAFDSANLTSAIQSLNHNSGGVFRLWLNDLNGSPISDARARIERFAIADPPRDQRQRETQQTAPVLPVPPTPAPAPQKSDSERKLEDVKDQLFTTALSRALNPQPLQPTTAPTLPPEQQATLFLLGNSEFMPNIFKQMAELASQAASVNQQPTWKQRAIDAALQLATTNPAIVDRLGGVMERIVARVLPDPRYDNPQLAPQPQYAPHTPPPQYAPPPRAINEDLPEAPQPEPVDDLDGDIMDILDGLVTLLNSNAPLTLNDPAILALQKAYPIKFRFAVRMIIASPLSEIIDWIKENGGPLYVSLLDGPASGPFLRERLAQLQTLLIEGQRAHAEKQQQQQQSKQTTDSAQPET